MLLMRNTTYPLFLFFYHILMPLVTRNPVPYNALRNMGSRPETVPMPANSHAQTSGYGFFWVRARVAPKNPRAACAEP